MRLRSPASCLSAALLAAVLAAPSAAGAHGVGAQPSALAGAAKTGLRQATAPPRPAPTPEILRGRQALAAAHGAIAAGNAAEALRQASTAYRLFDGQPEQRDLLDALDLQARAHRALGQWREALDAREAQLRLQQALDARMRQEQVAVLVAQSESARRDLQTLRLQQQDQAQRRALAAAAREERLRLLAIGLLGVLLLVVVAGLLLTRHRLRRARRDVATDSLTGVASRRQVLRKLAATLAGRRERDAPLSVLVIDIDHFKRINDSHGHAAGDQVLRAVAAACSDALRGGDHFGRTGGEEFLAVLPGTARSDAAGLAQRLRTAIAVLPLEAIAPGQRVTVSVGVAEAADVDTADTLLSRADAALYAAKRNGRDRVEVADVDAVHAPAPREAPLPTPPADALRRPDPGTRASDASLH